jgi:hypothetical protein
VEGSGVCVEVDLRVEGGGAFRTNVHDHLKSTWGFSSDVEITETANGYTGADTPTTISGTEVTELPTLDSQASRGFQRLLSNAADPQWLLTQEGHTAWLDLSQTTALEPAEIVNAKIHTLFVRALSADRAFSFSSSSGVTTHVANFSGTIQGGHRHEVRLPRGGDPKRRCSAVRDGNRALPGRLAVQAVESTHGYRDRLRCQYGSAVVPFSRHAHSGGIYELPVPRPLPLDAGSRQHEPHHQPAVRRARRHSPRLPIPPR